MTTNIWNTWEELCSPYANGNDVQISKVATQFIDRLSTAAPSLFTGARDLVMTESDTDAVLERLESGLSRPYRRIVQHLFRKGLERGNTQNIWTCHLPPIRRSIRPAKSMVRQNNFASLPILRTVQHSLMHKLEALPLNNSMVSAGLVILSAASYGGLIRKGWLEALSTVDEKSLALGPSGCRVELFDKKKPSNRRSFFPDRFTEFALLQHAARHGLPLSKARIESGAALFTEQALSAFATALGLDETITGSLKKNLHALSLPNIALEAPGAYVAYAIERVPSTDLPNQTSARIFGEFTSSHGVSAANRPILLPETPMGVPPLSTVSRRDGYLRSIQRLLAVYAQPEMTTTSVEVANQIRLLRADHSKLWSVETLITEWVLHLIELSGSQTLAPASLARYFQAIWQPLLVAAGDQAVESFDADSFCDFYDEALSLVQSVAGRHYLQSRLISFHGWLMKTRSAPEIDFSELDNYAPSAGTVNANLITVSEFKSALQLLDDPGFIADPTLREICANVMTLCFRTGVRRREPLQMRLCDFRRAGSTLWVRPSRYGSIKSAQSIRKLPLSALLETSELARFERWYQSVAGHCTNPAISENLLFSFPDKPQSQVPPQTVFGWIMKAVRAVTNDPSLVPHHLRHSFANWTFVKLQLANGGITVHRDVPAFSDSCFDLTECQRLKSSLYNFDGKRMLDAGRRDLYCVTALMGHLSPGTTMRSYLHLLDYMTSRYMRSYPKITRVEQIANLRGVDRSRIYQIAKMTSSSGDALFDVVLQELRNRLKSGLSRNAATSKVEIT